jgi:hypothetical protein
VLVNCAEHHSQNCSPITRHHANKKATTKGDEITTHTTKDFYGKWNAKSVIPLPQLPDEHR